MQKLLIDSTVIIKYLKNGSGILESLIGSYQLHISPVTYIELLASKRAAGDTVQKQLAGFLDKNFKLIELDEKIMQHTASLLRDMDLSLAHATIAATSIIKDTPLLTYDLQVFDQVPDLQLVEV